jgi:hypothetical protein
VPHVRSTCTGIASRIHHRHMHHVHVPNGVVAFTCTCLYKYAGGTRNGFEDDDEGGGGGGG